MDNVTIYHNPRCSKSRQTLSLLRDRDIEPTIIDYLRTPPNSDELQQILHQLNLTPRELIRTSEPSYKTLKLDDPNLTDQQILQALIQYPILIQRPIVVVNDKAIIGRPPENVLEILK